MGEAGIAPQAGCARCFGSVPNILVGYAFDRNVGCPSVDMLGICGRALDGRVAARRAVTGVQYKFDGSSLSECCVSLHRSQQIEQACVDPVMGISVAPVAEQP